MTKVSIGERARCKGCDHDIGSYHRHLTYATRHLVKSYVLVRLRKKESAVVHEKRI